MNRKLLIKQEVNEDQIPLSCKPPTSRKRARPHTPSPSTWVRERERRDTMTALFSFLHSIVPNLHPKAIRTTIVDETIKYIEQLEGEVEALEAKKRDANGGQREERMVYSGERWSVKVVVSGGNMATFGVRLEAGRGLVTKVLMVFEVHGGEVLMVNVCVNDGVTELMVNCFVKGVRDGDCVERIKNDIVSLLV